ncbi:hypothetical protein BDV95DRAFT_565239 [Massariosphaeria phaeospora]|uniref:Uncharacterized protein n=1 Tax=Massariosphaeria phaeospora TaxID=100035 RepID=A0A7C8MDK2_9PLEO|nr:hypothetical protein BDV95DRAFT_565239 [Massariosphaeria phaeospora]
MVNFTFVPHKGARPEKSELVKSHVMRESQRKRREAKTRRIQHASNEPHHTPTLPTQGSGTQYYVRDGRSSPSPHPTSNVAASQDSAGIAHSVSTSEAPLGSWPSSTHPIPNTQLGCLDSQVLQMPWPAECNPLAPDAVQEALQHRILDGTLPELDECREIFGQQHVPGPLADDAEGGAPETASMLTRQPSRLYPSFVSDRTSSDATWMSSGLYDRVAELVWYCTQSPRKPTYYWFQSLAAINPVSCWAQTSLLSAKILLSTAHFYCVYRDVVRGVQGQDHHYFKDRTLRLINMSFEDPETAVSDDNIAAVISMSMYEVRHTRMW